MVYRPNTLEGYIGNEQVKRNLGIALTAARIQNTAVDNILVTGPAGCGKTTIAKIVSNEMGTRIIEANGASLKTAGSIVALLTSLKRGDVLFLDEVHALGKTVETLLYNAMEDRVIYITVGDVVQTVLKINLPEFTVVGATNRQHLLTEAIRQRFTVKIRLGYYNPMDLTQIVLAQPTNVTVDNYGALEIAKRSRGTPRIAIANYRQALSFAAAKGANLTKELAVEAMEAIGIDDLGCTPEDRHYLATLINKAYGGPRGLTALCNMTNFEEGQVEDIEAWLMQLDLINLTDDGRVATDAAYAHMKQFMPISFVRNEKPTLKGV